MNKNPEATNNQQPRKPLRIAMVAYTFYESDNRVMRYAETLANRADHVEVIALRQRGATVKGSLHGVTVLRVQGREYREKGRFSYLFRLLLFSLKAMLLLSFRHLVRRYDVIHVHSVPDFLVFVAWLPKLMGCKIILDIHDILPEFYASKFKAKHDSLIFRMMLWVERLSSAFSDHVIIANHIWHERLISRAVEPARCTTILNFPVDEIFQARGRTRQDGKFIILFHGTLNAHQGCDVAIRAFHKIKDLAPQAEFHIYGAGAAKQEWMQLARDLGLNGRMLFRDLVPIREIAGVVENSDLGVIPKRKDSFGNEAFSTKILEFMTLRVPVIVSDTRIDTHYFDDSMVQFFPDGDAEKLAECMHSLMHDSPAKRRLIANAQAFAAKNTWAQHKHIYLDMVDRLASLDSSPRPLRTAYMRSDRTQ